MNTEYRVEPSGTQFAVIDAAGEQVDIYPTKEAVERDIERCKKDDRMYETAKQLMDTATKAHMQMLGIDRGNGSVLDSKCIRRGMTWVTTQG